MLINLIVHRYKNVVINFVCSFTIILFLKISQHNPITIFCFQNHGFSWKIGSRIL
jgi:hypothetical protein